MFIEMNAKKKSGGESRLVICNKKLEIPGITREKNYSFKILILHKLVQTYLQQLKSYRMYRKSLLSIPISG